MKWTEMIIKSQTRLREECVAKGGHQATTRAFEQEAADYTHTSSSQIKQEVLRQKQ